MSNQTYQAHSGTNTVLTAWIRDDAGRTDQSEAALTVEVFAYGGTTLLETLSATGTTLGKVTATLTTDIAEDLGPGLYRLDFKAGDTLLQTARLVIV